MEYWLHDRSTLIEATVDLGDELLEFGELEPGVANAFTDFHEHDDRCLHHARGVRGQARPQWNVDLLHRVTACCE